MPLLLGSYEKMLIIVTLVFSVMSIFNTLLYNIVTIITPDASASLNSTAQANQTLAANVTPPAVSSIAAYRL